ncbi:MAG: transketolase C-terminal domain-containing protein [Terracidiphilus sp.]|nr:transketolase C-terminal domain-containing protein [Terracidiphilus sp.]
MQNQELLNARTYSRLGQRGAIFGMAVLDAVRQDPRHLVITADLAQLSGLDRLGKAYPENLINVGIAEQNMLGIAAGLAAEGFKPIVTTYATFITMRSCEQCRHYLGYMKFKCIVVGSGAGLIQGFSGNTHYSQEDMSVMRTIPGMTVLSPSDATQAVKAFEAAQALEQSVYIRLSGGLGCPIVYKNDYTFEIGRPIQVHEGEDIVVYATGMMVAASLKVAELLELEGIHVRIVDVHTIKPLHDEILEYIGVAKLAVTVEEHNVIGGLGSAVAEKMSERGCTAPLLRLGIQDRFSRVGDYDYLLGDNRLQPEQIAQDIVDLWARLH